MKAMRARSLNGVWEPHAVPTKSNFKDVLPNYGNCSAHGHVAEVC